MNMFASYTVMDELLYYLDRKCVPHNGALRNILIQKHHEICSASWEDYLRLVEFAYNNSSHLVTGMTPFQAAYGHTPLVPTNFVLQHKVALADQLVQKMQDVLILVRDKWFMFNKSIGNRHLQDDLTDEMVDLARQMKEATLAMNKAVLDSEKVLDSTEQGVEHSLAATNQANIRAQTVYSHSFMTGCLTWLIMFVMFFMFLLMVFLIRIT
ncbi:hypothetical protein L7F22_018696 [Adiantum nelumboides]|nr:hypothetical protein [Adiantum nelumboides]